MTHPTHLTDLLTLSDAAMLALVASLCSTPEGQSDLAQAIIGSVSLLYEHAKMSRHSDERETALLAHQAVMQQRIDQLLQENAQLRAQVRRRWDEAAAEW